MVPPSSLFFSPHPDDLVYSAFGALIDHAKEADAVIFFNASRFTKWGLLPKNFVTLARTLEETIILSRLHIRSSFLWMNDYSCRDKPLMKQKLPSKLAPHRPLRNLFCPLGIGGHPDHLAVRELAIEYWLKCEREPRICLYEDLPYAARISRVDDQVERCVTEVSRLVGRLVVCCRPLTDTFFRKKLFFSGLYLTQNDHSKLLESRGRELGKKCGAPYAESYVCSAD